MQKPEVTDRFQNGRHRHVGNSRTYFLLGNYHPILLKFVAQADRHAEFKNRRRGSAGQFSRWPPPPFWKFKCVL
jgi:hypothetical protein